VLPTAEPLFSPERSCRPESTRPIAAGLHRRALPAVRATHPATRLALPTVSAAASRWVERDTCRAETAMPSRSAKSRECPRSSPGWRPRGVPGCPCAASAQAAAARSAPTAHRSTAPIASCSYKKFIKAKPSCKEPSLRPYLFMKHALDNFRRDPMLFFLTYIEPLSSQLSLASCLEWQVSQLR